MSNSAKRYPTSATRLADTTCCGIIRIKVTYPSKPQTVEEIASDIQKLCGVGRLNMAVVIYRSAPVVDKISAQEQGFKLGLEACGFRCIKKWHNSVHGSILGLFIREGRPSDNELKKSSTEKLL